MLTLQISTMTCGHCASTITRAIAGVDQHARVDVDMPGKRVHITSAAADEALMQAIQDAGYTPQRVTAAPGGRSRAGCGCGCGPRATAPVDMGQATAPQAKSCCG
jgi:copper chaperone